jgi:hypothetical protein
VSVVKINAITVPRDRFDEFAPSLANARAVARPMPLVAPVTNATLPSKRPLTGSP